MVQGLYPEAAMQLKQYYILFERDFLAFSLIFEAKKKE